MCTDVHLTAHEASRRGPIIAPSMLAADFGRFAEEAHAVFEAEAEWLHLDIMDGVFVPNISFGPDTVRALRKATPVTFDIHLMIESPDIYLRQFAEAGADRITVHAEAGPHLHRSVTTIRSLGKKAGVALNPATSESSISYVLDDIEQILIMSVNPGFGGQHFIPSTLGKIARVREMVGDRGIEIVVDGGVNVHNAKQIIQAGANVLVAGSAVFQGGPDYYARNVAALKATACE